MRSAPGFHDVNHAIQGLQSCWRQNVFVINLWLRFLCAVAYVLHFYVTVRLALLIEWVQIALCIFVIYELYPQFPCCLNLLFGPLSLCYIFISDCRTFITFGSMIDKIFHKCSSIFSSIIPVLPSAMCWKERCKFLAFMNYRCKKIVLLSFIFF